MVRRHNKAGLDDGFLDEYKGAFITISRKKKKMK